MQSINTIQELKELLSLKDGEYVLLDVRTPEEYSAGHIPSSINFDISHPNFIQEMEQLDHTKTYILYCRSGGRSQMCQMVMNQKGIKTINCQFGFPQWRSSGEAVE
jgi:phage shock protein E